MTTASATSSQTPSFRYDLQTEALEKGGKRYVEVSCPDKGNSFRFYEVEYALACGMDGTRNVGALVAWAKSELDLVTTEDEVSAIISKLADLSYLGSDSSVVSTLAASPAPAKVASVTAEIAVAEPEDVISDFDPDPPTIVPGFAPAGTFVEPPMAESPNLASMDVELGMSGKSTLAQPPATPFNTQEVELGHSGPVSDQLQSIENDDYEMELGIAGNEDSDEVHDDEIEATVVGHDPQPPSDSVSTDLSQTFRIDQDEVKAAVRASQVMSAVTLPDDLVAELEAAEVRKKAEADLSSAIPVAISPKDEISDQIAADVEEDLSRAASEDGAEAIVIPDEKPEKVTPKIATSLPPPEKSRPSASYGLWAVLLLVTALGAGYYYMEFVREDPDKAEKKATPRVQNTKPTPPPAPVVPSAILKVAEPEVTEILSDKVGSVGTMVEAGTEVEVGDVLITFSQAAKVEKALAKHQASLDSYQVLLTKLQAGKNAAKTNKMQLKVTRKETDVANSKEALTAFQITSSSAGTVELIVEAGAAVTAETPVAKVTAAAKTMASFTLNEAATQAVGDEVKVESKADAKVGATCTVAKVEGKVLSLECPGDFPPDTEIVVAP